MESTNWIQARIELLNMIGKGNYGEVWTARLHDPEAPETQFVAVKIELEEESLEKEFIAMKEIGKHHNLIEYKEYAKNIIIHQQQSSALVSYLALELADNKALLNFLMTRQEQLPEQWTRYWFTQILMGLNHIKKNGFSHLDIKCENILLDKHLNVKIGDFGFASRNDQGIWGTMGSQFHRAPEIFEEQRFDGEKADIFALSIVLFALHFKAFPIESQKIKDEVKQFDDVRKSKNYKLLQTNKNKFWAYYPQVSAEFRDLFEGMSIADPNKRLTIDQVLSHAWVQNSDVPTDEEIAQQADDLTRIREGDFNSWRQQDSLVEIYVPKEKVYKSYDNDELEEEIDKAYEILIAQERNIDKYHPIHFEWTHFKANGKAQKIMAIAQQVIKIYNAKGIEFDLEIEKSDKMSAKLTQKSDTQDYSEGSNLIEGNATIYQDGDSENRVWFIMKRYTGDIFEFSNLFLEIVKHSQINNLLLKE